MKVEVNLPEPRAPRERRRHVLRVCVLGAESTGKTTIAAALADHYSTLWVPEYGAPYHHVGRGDPYKPWTSGEFVHIARIRDWLEEFLAGYASRVLFCDTDTFVTCVFHQVYLGESSDELAAMVEPQRYALHLLCDVHTPFHPDRLGLRREDARLEMHRRYVEHLEGSGVAWIELRGDHDERLRSATAAVDALL